ncbi:MAG: response regulator, partial [Candidatus Methylomirabilis sp.]|nr:response regulator [Deltaproteobacteria bacterium]
FNNLLTAILGYAEMARDGLGGDEPVRGNVEEILGAARQAADLTSQLLAFSRKQVLEVQPLDLNDAVRAMSKLLRRVIGEHVRLETILQPELGTVEADPSQMRQVVLNLAINARDAMPEGGRLVIETSDVEIDEEYAARRPEVSAGRYVMIAVSDTGVGMDAATQARIFEPFFTTKGPGRGTGLGLATVHGVVKQSGGHVWVYSEPGRGTTFRIYFPRVDRAAQPVSFDEDALRRVLRGAETVLLCEDEATLRRLVRATLERKGYRVLEAESPERALEIAAAPETGKVDLLVTDVIMPGMNGRQLAERLDESHGLRAVLYVSGYTQNIIAHHGVLKPGVHFLPKPFTQDALLRKVREVVDSSGEKP